MSIQVVRPPTPSPYVIVPTASSGAELRLVPMESQRVSLRHGNWAVSVSYADLQAALDEIADMQQEDDDE